MALLFPALLALVPPAFTASVLGQDKMFIRFTNNRPDAAGILIRVNIVPNHDELTPPGENPLGWDGKTIYVGKNVVSAKPDGGLYLAPGETSGWIDIGQYMNRQGTRSKVTYQSPVLCGVLTEPRADGLYLLAEVAQGAGTRVIRRIEVKKPELPADAPARKYPWLLGYHTWNSDRPFLPTLGLLIPVRPDIVPRIYTLEEAFQNQLRVIEKFPDIGRPPTQLIFNTVDYPEMKSALGYNSYPPGTVEGSLGDEIGLRLNMSADEQNRRFREYLKAKGIDPLDALVDEDAAKVKGLPADRQWEMVTLPKLPYIDEWMDESVLRKPILYYEQANFRYRLWNEELAAGRMAIEAQHPGRKVLVGANFSPHMNVWPDVRQWVNPFRTGAMTMTWTEDWWWQLPEVSPQIFGFLLDGFRLAGSYHGAPAHFFIMKFEGQSGDNFNRMHSLAYAHGVKIINHFVTQNQVLMTWDYVDQQESPRTYQAVYDMLRDAGAVEDRLAPAMPKKAEVAILLSLAADTWDTADLGGVYSFYSRYNVNNDERKAIWLALRQAQYPVDMITDEDMAEGKLAGYKVLYVVGSEMLSTAVKPLADWVRAGGIVYATGGGGLLDEYHRDNAALYEVYGLKSHALNRAVRSIRPRTTLPRLQPLDRIALATPDGHLEGDYPVLCYRDALALGSGKMAGQYKGDNSPALVTNAYGNGQAYYSGALFGLAYLTPAMTSSAQILPTAFPADLRSIITRPVVAAKITQLVVASDPLVEAQYMTGPAGAIVTLTNWSDKPIDKVIIRFPGVPVKTVQSLRAAGFFKGYLRDQPAGHLPVQIVDGVPQVELRLEVTDYLLID